MDISISRSWDPLYGRVDFSDFEYKLLSSPEVQRLRYIRMCNINSLLVTGASEISRFEHTIGVLRLAQEWIKQNAVPASKANIVRAAALLHDMQTGPFGHSLQYILEDNAVDGEFAHEDLSHGSSRMYFQTTDANAAFSGSPFKSISILKDLWPSVAETIRGEGAYGPLIAGTIDLDNIDNVIRLGFHAGAANSADSKVALKLARDIALRDGKVSFSKSSIPLIMRWQEIRRRLYHLLLLDWAEFSAKAMLTLAMELSVQHKVIGSDSWLYSDFQLLEHLETHSVGEGQQITDLVRRIKVGKLYYPILLVSSTSVGKYNQISTYQKKRELESIIDSRVNEKHSDDECIEGMLDPHGTPFLIHYILDKGKTERSLPVYIRDEESDTVLGGDSNKVLIGLFISQQPKSLKAIQQIKEIALIELKKMGFKGLKDIEDPMGGKDNSLSEKNNQLPLI